MAARLNRRHQDSVRQKIQANRIVEELTKHVYGKREMTSTQVRAAEILLNKSISNLQSTEAVIEYVVTDAAELSDSVLANIAAAGSSGVVEEARGEEESSSVH